jgi:hypothetical protein
MTPDLEARIRHTMRVVAETTAIPAAPLVGEVGQARRHRLRSRLAAVIAAGGIAAIGVGAAAAGGVLTPGADKAFGDWQDINPREAILLAELPGPYGTEVAAYEAPNHSNGETCIAYALHGDPAYRGQGSIGGQCSKLFEADHAFGRSGGWNSQIEYPGRPNFSVFALSAGPDAVTADLTYDGVAHPVAVGHGYLVGWAPDAKWASATLTAYDANGAVVGVIYDVGSPDGHPIISPPPTTP